MGGGLSSWENSEGGGRSLEEENLDGRRRSQGINIKVKGPSPIVNLNLQCQNSTPPPYQTITNQTKWKEVQRRMRRWWRSEEGRGQRIESPRGQRVPGSKGPRYLKLIFKYELDSKEGPSFSENALKKHKMPPFPSDLRYKVYLIHDIYL